MKSSLKLRVIAVCLLVGSCRKASEEPGTATPAQPGISAPKTNAETPKGTSVSFPQELNVTDSSVNAFVKSTLESCATGQYESFRSVWTAREGPISREEFEKGWHAAKSIRVRAMEKVKLATDASTSGSDSAASPQIAYALAIDLSLDPEQQIGQRKPERQVVLLVTREKDEWRLARAPKGMREWIKKKFEADTTAQPKNSTPLESTNSVKREP